MLFGFCQPVNAGDVVWLALALRFKGQRLLRIKEKDVNWNQVQGNWKQLKGKVKEQWGVFTDDELEQIDGKREILVGHIQEKYGIAQEEAEKQVKAWEKTQN
jgi:uncharacterized protein YjbJ (UPF0337 family)